MFDLFEEMDEMFNQFCAESDEFIEKQKERQKKDQEDKKTA